MEKQTFNQWVEARETHRESLFGETMHEAAKSDVPSSLASLALNSNLNGFPTNYELVSRTDLQAGVSAILKYHNTMGSQDVDGALFSLVDDDALKRISDATAKTVFYWERACKRLGHDSPFEDLPIGDIRDNDFGRKDVQLIVETAAAIAEIIPKGAGFSVHNNSPGENKIRSLAIFTARYGPRFAEDIVSGRFVREYCEEQGYDPNKWLRYLPRSRLMFDAVRSSDPLRRMRRTIDHYETYLSNEQIAEHLGWDKQRVESIFIQSTKLTLASGVHPLQVLDRLAHKLDTSLSTATLIEVLDWPEEDITEVFSERFRAGVALNYKDPLAYIRKIADAFTKSLCTENLIQELELSRTQVEALFPYSVRKRLSRRKDPTKTARNILQASSKLASQYGLPQDFMIHLVLTYKPANHHRIAQIIQRDMHSPPRGISPALWIFAIGHSPYSQEKRLNYLQAYLAYRNIRNPASLDTQVCGTPYNMVVNGQTYDPAELFDMSEPSEFLYDLADNAGVSDAELSSLLAQFTEKDIEEFGADDLATLQKLRQAAA